ncbi:hypothetical protein ATI45_4093 [Marinobacter sp. LV10MA510-1]|nr:hypothetical protein ATI45_4093 [Marinobacter sp. LV10MA510-1]
MHFSRKGELRVKPCVLALTCPFGVIVSVYPAYFQTDAGNGIGIC